MTVMRGPENMSVNDDVGLLVEGFDSPPAIMMPYNPRYYPALVEARGFRKAMDLYAWYGDARELEIPEKITRGIELCRRRYGFQVRSMDMRRFDEEIRKIHTGLHAGLGAELGRGGHDGGRNSTTSPRSSSPSWIPTSA